MDSLRLYIKAILDVGVQGRRERRMAIEVDGFKKGIALLDPRVADGLVHLMNELIEVGRKDLVQDPFYGPCLGVRGPVNLRIVFRGEAVSCQDGSRFLTIVNKIHLLTESGKEYP